MKRIEKMDLDAILLSTLDLWSQMSGKTIFITGGTGFFGMWLLESFVYINRKINLNAKLIILTRNKIAFTEKYPFTIDYDEVLYIEGDVSNFKYPDYTIDYVIHAATEANEKVNTEQPLLMLDTIINGTKHVLNLAIAKNVKSLLLTSSGVVYGKQPVEITKLSEDFNGGPNINSFTSVYAEGKRVAELLCSIYYSKSNLPVKIARCFTFVGPYLPLDRQFAIGNFIHDVLKNIPIKINSDGSGLRGYLYASDLATWLWTILLKGKNNYPYNVGSDHEISFKNVASIISEYGMVNEIIVLNKLNEHQKKNRYIPSVKRCKEELFLLRNVELEQAILKTINFYKNDY